MGNGYPSIVPLLDLEPAPTLGNVNAGGVSPDDDELDSGPPPKCEEGEIEGEG